MRYTSRAMCCRDGPPACGDSTFPCHLNLTNSDMKLCAAVSHGHREGNGRGGGTRRRCFRHRLARPWSLGAHPRCGGRHLAPSLPLRRTERQARVSLRFTHLPLIHPLSRTIRMVTRVHTSARGAARVSPPSGCDARGVTQLHSCYREARNPISILSRERRRPQQAHPPKICSCRTNHDCKRLQPQKPPRLSFGEAPCSLASPG